MKYFEVEMSSEHFCGFYTTRYMKAEDEFALEETIEYKTFIENMRDYIQGHCDDDDYEEYDDPCALLIGIGETTKEKYEERKDWGTCG